MSRSKFCRKSSRQSHRRSLPRPGGCPPGSRLRSRPKRPAGPRGSRGRVPAQFCVLLSGPACAPGAGSPAKPVPAQGLALRLGAERGRERERETEWPGRSRALKTTRAPSTKRPLPAQSAAEAMCIQLTLSRAVAGLSSNRAPPSVGQVRGRVRTCVWVDLICECGAPVLPGPLGLVARGHYFPGCAGQGGRDFFTWEPGSSPPPIWSLELLVPAGEMKPGVEVSGSQPPFSLLAWGVGHGFLTRGYSQTKVSGQTFQQSRPRSRAGPRAILEEQTRSTEGWVLVSPSVLGSAPTPGQTGLRRG